MDKIVCTVSRKTWARGGVGGQFMLLNDQGNKCCLGFLGEVCGVAKEHLLYHGLPGSLNNEDYLKYPSMPPRSAEPLAPRPSIAWSDFAHINDDDRLNEADREVQLQILAEQNGFTFVFVD